LEEMVSTSKTALLERPGGRSRATSTVNLVGGLALVCVGLTMLAQQQTSTSVLVARMDPLRQEQLARALMLKGAALAKTAQQEIAMGQQLAAGGLDPVQGMMLAAGNDTNATASPPVGLEANGVNVDMWPQNHEVRRLPGYMGPEAVNESEYNNTLDSIDEDYDYYNRKNMLDAGVNIGSWFWEDPDMDEGPKNETAPPSPEEEAADEELEAILAKMENATSPEEVFVCVLVFVYVLVSLCRFMCMSACVCLGVHVPIHH